MAPRRIRRVTRARMHAHLGAVDSKLWSSSLSPLSLSLSLSKFSPLSLILSLSLARARFFQARG